ncbi:peptide MFS transporter [Skermania piniformis]|uniref:peptide MFS transporter n=1 Tax=Skermania pinensis TaxID=39122 RepID=UPI0039EA232B
MTDEDALHDRAFFGQPRGLSTLFFVELWERFSYYGMRAILLYFLIDTAENGGLGLTESNGTAVVSIYGSMVYLLSILGGFAADRVIGARRSVLYGGMVIMAGHVLLALPPEAAAWSGIVLVAIGTGLLKPNVSSMVGELYATHDRRRDAGFSIFYMAVNVGALVSPFVVGWLRDRWGYHAGFSAAAVGMAIALVFYFTGRKHLRGAGDDVPNPLSSRDRARLPLFGIGAVVALAVLIMITGLWRDTFLLQVIDAITILSLGAPVVYFAVMFRSPKVTSRERTHLAAYLPLWIGAMLFWMIAEQAAGKMALFAQQNTVTSVGGIDVDPEWFQSVGPLTIILLAPVFGWIWTRRAGRFPSTAAKFAIGVTMAGLSALFMSWAFATFTDNTAPVTVLITAFVILTIGELCLSPVGLSATTRLAPVAFMSQSLALWYLASAAGQAIAAQLISAMGSLGNSTYYLVNGVMTLGFAVALTALTPWIRGKMKDTE